MEDGKIIARIPNGSQEIRIRESSYKDVEYIDVRKFYFDPPHDSRTVAVDQSPPEYFKPTRKGISLTPEQWKEVLELVGKELG